MSPGPAASSSSRWPGWSEQLLDHPGRHRHSELADRCGPPPIRRRPAPSARGSPLAARRGRATGSRRSVGSLAALREAARDLAEGALDLGCSAASGRSPSAPRRRSGASRSTAALDLGPALGGMSACANGFQISRTNSSTNERDTESLWRSMSSSTASALRARSRAPRPRRRCSAATGSGPRSGRRRPEPASPSLLRPRSTSGPCRGRPESAGRARSRVSVSPRLGRCAAPPAPA